MQSTPQKREYNFKPGVSGNPSGETAAQRFRRELVAMFVDVHGRQPGTIELSRIESLAFARARQRKAGHSAAELAALGNLVDRLNARLFEGVPFLGDTSGRAKAKAKRARAGATLAQLEGRAS